MIKEVFKSWDAVNQRTKDERRYEGGNHWNEPRELKVDAFSIWKTATEMGMLKDRVEDEESGFDTGIGKSKRSARKAKRRDDMDEEKKQRREFAKETERLRQLEKAMPGATAGAAVGSTGGATITPAAIAAAPPAAQKPMIGEKLFPIVRKINTTLAGKITGIMLKMDNSELLRLIESGDEMKAKV